MRKDTQRKCETRKVGRKWKEQQQQPPLLTTSSLPLFISLYYVPFKNFCMIGAAKRFQNSVSDKSHAHSKVMWYKTSFRHERTASDFKIRLKRSSENTLDPDLLCIIAAQFFPQKWYTYFKWGASKPSLPLLTILQGIW